MTRNIHDTFAKEWMQQLLTDFGTVTIETQISSEVRTIDIVFHPDPAALPLLPALGLLGQMLTHPICAIEAFRNAIPEWEIRNCTNKLFHLENELTRQSPTKIPKTARPFLWILTHTLSKHLQTEFKAEPHPTWGQGIYFVCNAERTAIIAIHQLPKTIDTLWLRLLGKGHVQSEAIAELIALPPDHPYRQDTLKHISILQVNLQVRQNKTKATKETIMNLSPAYEEWHRKTIAEGAALAQQAFEQTRQTIIAEGEARGEAKAAEKVRRSLAQKMLQEGASVEFVTKVTGFSAAEIAALG
jgi:hypothetical protein